MGLNVKKLKGLQKGINKAAGDGDDLFLYANKLGEADDIRILPPLPHMNGIYFAEQIMYWINGKPYLSNETFKQDCIIQAVIDEAKAKNEEELNALINAKGEYGPLLKREIRYLMPILFLDCKYDDDEELKSFKVADGEAKVLVAKPSLLKTINAIVTARPYQNGTDNGIMDREKGWNLIVGKTGKGLKTEYSAMGWTTQLEMDEKYYTEKAIPDVIKLTDEARKSDAYLESVIRNYLYGDDILEETAKKKSTSEKSENGKKATSKKTGKSLLDDAADYSEDDDELDGLG